MRYLLFFLATLPFLAGCNGADIFLPVVEADGTYEGWVQIDHSSAIFPHSFNGELRIWDNSYQAELSDGYSNHYDASYVEYDFVRNTLDVYFRVKETGWSPECGQEMFEWQMRMSGRIDSNEHYRGEIRVDLDPQDYQSEHCYLDYDPPSEHLGSFDLDLKYRDF